MEKRLTFTMSAYIYILCASAGFTDAYVSCNRSEFDDYVNSYCLPAYNQSMESSNYLDRCPWPSTRGFYITLDLCVEEVVRLTGCVEPSIKDQVFLEVHRTYFSLCSYMQSPDLPTLLLLMLPCIIAVLVLPITSVYFTTCRPCSASSPGL